MALKTPKETKALSKTLEESITWKDGNYKDDESFYTTLPDDLPRETVDRVDMLRERFIDASALAVSNKLSKADDPAAMLDSPTSAIASFTIGENQQVNHVMMQTDDEWSTHTEVNTDLSENSVLLKLQETITGTLNK